jgi:DNA replication ATP-dependent helicase Dna2
MPQSASDFLLKIRKFVEDEADAQFSALEHQWSRPLQERVANGWAIEGLHVERFQNGIVRLVCATNNSRFREGDLVILHHGNPQDKDVLHFDLQYDGELELDASLIHGNEVFLSANSDGWIMDQDWFDSSPFYRSALDKVADSQLGRSVILPLLQSTLKPSLTS